VPFHFNWILEGRLAGMGRPGCNLELAGQMLPHEQRFLAWLNSSSSLAADRADLAKRIGIQAGGAYQLERRMLDLYKKFRDIWGILAVYREGFGQEGALVDRFDLSLKRQESDLAFVRDQGIDTIVTLTETPLDGDLAAPLGFETVHIPIPDRTAPTAEQIDAFVAFVDERLAGGHRVLVHCLGGYGRTGTMLACYLVHCGCPAQAAIEEIREKRPGSVEPGEQERAVVEYEERQK